jgi:hypothetical protein
MRAKALPAFVDAAAAKHVGPEVAAFIAPSHDSDQAIADLDTLTAIVAKPQLEILATNLAPSKTAAWIVAQVSGARSRIDSERTVSTPLRASAFLTLAQMCGNLDPGYEPPMQIAAGAAPAVMVIKRVPRAVRAPALGQRVKDRPLALLRLGAAAVR